MQRTYKCTCKRSLKIDIVDLIGIFLAGVLLPIKGIIIAGALF